MIPSGSDKKRNTHSFALVTLAGLCTFGLNMCTNRALNLRPDANTRLEQNRQILEAIMELGEDGDWLVIRGYKSADDFISAVTNSPISHAAILDKTRNQVIEGDAKGVHTTELPEFIDKSHRLVLIRSIWSEQGHGPQGLAKARSLVGKKYDYAGLVGLDHPERYYCSELAVRIYEPYQNKQHRIPLVIEPGHLYLWGSILYDSRPRHWNNKLEKPKALPIE